MTKNAFLDRPKPDADKMFAQFEKFAAEKAKRLDIEAKKVRRELDEFKPQKGAKYAEKDPKPEEFHGQAFLVLESFGGDPGDRPIDVPPRSSCLSVTDAQGRTPNGISAAATLNIKCAVRNLGDTHVHNGSVEFFLGDGRFHPAEHPFRMVVDDVFVIAGRGLVAVGPVVSGALQAGQQILVRHGNQEVGSMVSGVQQGTARAGETVGLLLRGLRREQVPRGAEIVRLDQVGQEVPVATVDTLDFLGSVPVAVEAFGRGDATWTEQITQNLPSGFLRAVIYARVYSQAPEQLPTDFDRLDPETERLVAWVPLG